MPQYANQDTVIINRNCDLKQGNFVSIPKDILYRAMQDLSGNDFKVWLYLCGNKDGYQLDFSPAYIKSITGVSRPDRSKIKLQELGYLVEERPHLFNFYVSPKQ